MTQTPPQSPSRQLAIIMFVIAAAGGPVAVYKFFYEEVTKEPGLWLALVLLYEVVVVVIFGFVAKVWQKLESKWGDRVAEGIDTRLRSVSSGYRQRYLQHLIYQHRSFDVKGLSTQGVYTLELEQVFVELSLVRRPLHQIPADPFKNVPEQLRTGQHPIWDYLKAETMAHQHLAVIGIFSIIRGDP